MLPTLTPEQRDEALRKAARMRRPAPKKARREAPGTMTLADVLTGLTPRCARQGVAGAPRHAWCRCRAADKMLAEVGIDRSVVSRVLAQRQRQALADAFAAA